MARNNSYLTEEEKKARVLMIADFIIKTKSSTRKTAKFFTENYFPISNCTVHDYINNRLLKIDAQKYKEIVKILNLNTPKTIRDAQIKIRIYQAAALMLQDYTVEEIANLLNSTKDTIYDDLTSRLPKLDEKIAEDVKRKLLEHRYANLTQNTPKIEENPLILK